MSGMRVDIGEQAIFPTLPNNRGDLTFTRTIIYYLPPTESEGERDRGERVNSYASSGRNVNKQVIRGQARSPVNIGLHTQ